VTACNPVQGSLLLCYLLLAGHSSIQKMVAAGRNVGVLLPDSLCLAQKVIFLVTAEKKNQIQQWQEVIGRTNRQLSFDTRRTA
jgi:hypothetical protein